MTALRVIAGKTAAKRIEQQGLTPDLVKGVLGASGGPKWLVLSGLDRFVFGRWLTGADHTVPLIGSSIGAWRMTLAAHPEPLKMFDKFLDAYLQYSYTKGETARDTTIKSYELLNEVFSDDDCKAVVENSAKRPLNIVAVRAKGLAASQSTAMQAAGLILAMVGNLASRNTIGSQFDRVVFHTGATVPFSELWTDFNRIDVPLLPEALMDAVMASGSIPAVIDPIVDIAGAPPGQYRDGGITDYHFDIPFAPEEGIILYPHFYSQLTPGWFDKHLGRKAGPDVMEHMILLTPSEDFIAGLPDGQRTDRKDFLNFEDVERHKRWRSVVSATDALADEFEDLLENSGRLLDRLEVIH